MNNKPNYKKGYKGEILYLLYENGIIPYTALRLLEGETRLYQRAVKDMEKNEIVKIEKNNGHKYVRLNIESLLGKEVRKSVPEEYVEYYKKTSSDAVSRMTEKSNTSNERTERNTSTQIMMYSVNIQTGMKAKNLAKEKIEKDDCYYYHSIGLKKLDDYKDKVEKKRMKGKDGETETKKISNSRANGMLISPGGMYVVYNIGQSLVEWKRFGEVKMIYYLKNLVKKRQSPDMERAEIEEAIVIASKKENYVDICTREYKLKEICKKVILMNIDYAYKSMYAVPQDADGKLMLKIMIKEGWKERIYNSILNTEERREREFVQITCDGYDKSADVYKYVFCVPDLVRLKAYAIRAKMENEKERFTLYCYTWQREIVAEIIGQSANIYTIDIRQLYSELFTERNEEKL